MANNNLLQEGQTIKHDGQNLHIEKRLPSGGLTSEGYKALLNMADQRYPVSVFIKAMKTLDSPMARQLFYQEGGTLQFLMHLEEETPDSLADNLKIAPVYYGLSEYQPDPDIQGFPYLVMEFITGKQVPELLNKQGKFSELQALTAAWHLYRILDILHTRLKRAFIDLKFENLWWLENDSKWGGQLKMTDFGTLEEINTGDVKKRGVARDVLLGGVYLLAMLTGYKLDYSIGELNEPAKPVISRFEKNMTWGTRRLLRKLLHRNIDARFNNASDVLTELRQLVNFWSQSPERLSEMAQKNIALAESAAEQAKSSNKPLSEAGLAAATRAYSVLDILKIKDPQRFNERDIRRVESVLSVGDYFERGYALLQGRSFTLARQTFEEGLPWTDDPAILRRWSHAARIGEEVPPKDFEERFSDLKTLLDFINQSPAASDPPTSNSKKWQSAQRDFTDLASTSLGKPSLKSKGLDYLIAECELFDALEQAESCRTDGKYSEASAYYENAKTILENRFPPDIGKPIEEETGSLSALRRNVEEHQDREASLEKFEDAGKALKNGETRQAVEFATQAYHLDRYAPFRFEKLAELSLTALELSPTQPERIDEYIRVSRRFADIGLQEFGGDADFDKICNASVKLDLAVQNITSADSPSFCAALEDAHSLLGEKGSMVEGVAVYAAKVVGRQPLFLEDLANSVEKIIPSSKYPAKWREEASKVSAEQSATRHEKVDELMREVYSILLPVLPDPNNPKTLAEILRASAEYANVPGSLDILDLQNRLARLEQSKVLLDKVAKISGTSDEYRQEEISSLSQAVTEGIDLAQTAGAGQKQAQEDARRSRIFALSEERIKIHEELNKAKQSSLWDINLDAKKSLYTSLRAMLADFHTRCYQTKAGDPEGLQESIERQKTLQETGQDAVVVDAASLDVFIRWANRELDALGGEDGVQIVEAFKEADADFALGNLGYMEAILERTHAKWSNTPEWKIRKALVAQANAWKSWCESNSKLFQTTKVDADLLRNLRDFTNLALPVVYWEKSPAGQYLEQVIDNLNGELPAAIKTTIHDDQFIEMIRALLNVTWTKQLAVSNVERRNWEMAKWLQGTYGFARSKNPRGMLEHIYQTPPPENVDEALHSFTYTDWENLRLADRHSQDSQAKATLTRQRLLFGGGIGLAVCIVLVLAGSFIYSINKGGISQVINGSYTPTLTLTPTITSTPTLTPTITLTPTETPTLTPVPPSKFLLPDVGSLYPASPINGNAYWLLNDTDAIVASQPGGSEKAWKEAKSSDKSGKSEKFIYTVTGNANINWVMDTPFDVAGYYQIFVLDTKQYSSQSQSFNVFLNQQPVQPYRGTNQVIFQDAQQKTDTWVSLGVYQANAGQTLAVQIAVSELTDKTPFALDRLLVVRLDDQSRLMLDQLPSGRTLASLLDDPAANFFEVVQDKPTQVKDRGSFFTDVPAWNGILSSRLLDQSLTIPVWVEWSPENRLAAGTYEVYVWIPAQHATVIADYFLLADGKVVERPNPANINQKDHAGVWLSLGTWDLPQESMVSLRMAVPAGMTGEIGVDAVAIVAVK